MILLLVSVSADWKPKSPPVSARKLRCVLHEHVEHYAFLRAGETRLSHGSTEEISVAPTKFTLIWYLDIVTLLAGLSSLHDLSYKVSQLAAFEDLHHEVKGLVDSGVFGTDADLVKPLACFHVAHATY